MPGAMPNAKTAAAARKQAPVVAVNALRQLDRKGPTAGYDGYGSCPLTVERGKIVLAEFAYGGKTCAELSHMAGRRHQTDAAVMDPESRSLAVDLLERHAEGPRVAGRARRP